MSTSPPSTTDLVPPPHRLMSAADSSSSSSESSTPVTTTTTAVNDEVAITAAAKLREAQELAARLRRQVQLLEMELLLRGGESRESLTGLLSSLELRDSFRFSDCATSDALFADDGAAVYAEDELEPEEELAVLGSESFFVEKLIDSNDLTDDEEDYGEAVGSANCADCEQLQRKLSEARESEEHARDAITVLAARLEGRRRSLSGTKVKGGEGGSEDENDDADDVAAVLLAQKVRAALAQSRTESDQRIQQLEVDRAELQKREAAAQHKIDALENELALARALSRQHKQQPEEEEEEELLLESGGVASADRRHGPRNSEAGTLEQLLGRRWGRSETGVALLVALALLCVTLASVRY